MSDLEKKARIFSNTEGNQSSKLMREVEYDTGRYVGYLAGFKDCQKEYEEKLRWIPVAEKLPEKIQKQPYITHVVQVKSTTFAEPLCAYYNHDHCVWLSYPFGNSAKLLTVTHWRYFL